MSGNRAPYSKAEWGLSQLHFAIAQHALLSGEFKLSNGGTSNFYFDLRRVFCRPTYMTLICEAWTRLLANTGRRFTLIGGPACGGIALAAGFSQYLYRLKDYPYAPGMFYHNPKEHGVTGDELHGTNVNGADVLIVDDVVTSGMSVIRVVEAVKTAGGRVMGVCAILDREAGGMAELAVRGLDVHVLFRVSEFKEEIDYAVYRAKMNK